MKNRIVRVLCALILSALVFSIAVSSVCAASDDYSYPYATATVDIYADEFLETYIDGIELSDVEADFLRLQSGFLLSYNSHIPTYVVVCDYDAEEKTLTVTANEYRYTATNGVEVVWKPVTVTLGSNSVNLLNTSTAVFTEVSNENNTSVDVKYSASFTVTEEKINELVNLACNSAPLLEDEINKRRAEYEQSHSAYLANVEKYNEYLAALELYNEYLTNKRIYDEKYAEYLEYCEAFEEYEAAKAEYDAYLEAREQYYKDLALYTKYLAYYEKNQALVERYAEYQEKIDTVGAQLDIIKKTKTPVTSLERTVYGAIMGDTVTSVIKNKGDIVKLLGADAKVVDMAGIATENLRVLLKEFFKLKNVKAQYNYYITNYEAFRDNFVNLLKALDNLYLNDGVRGAMISQQKEQKYIILLAQLYCIANALSDEPVMSYGDTYCYDSNYKIGIGYGESDKMTSVEEALEWEIFIPDTNNAAPLADGFPIEPEKPEYTAMSEPQMPSPVTAPIEPETVEEPTAPSAVSEPEVVKKPGKEPKPYEAPNEVLELISAYNSGDISKRADYEGGDVTLSPEITVSKAFVGGETVTVTYYAEEYGASEEYTTLYTVTVDKGSYADYLGELPEKEEDAEYIYSHLGWADSNGKAPNFTAVTDNLSLYPTFSREEKEYETVWIADGNTYYENPIIPPLPSGEEHYYDFSYWQRSVDPETGNVTYTAVYDTPLVLAGKDAARVEVVSGNYIVYPASVSNNFNISTLLARAAGNGSITIKTVRGEEIFFSYAETLKLYKSGVASISYSAAASGGEYAYILNAYGDDGEAVECSVKAAFTAACVPTDLSHLVLYYVIDGVKIPTHYDFGNNIISFGAVLGRAYYAKVEYSLTAVPLEEIEISTNKAIAAKGELVTVELDYPGGIRIDRVYLLDSLGNKIYLDSTSFEMPACDVAVGVEYTVLEYKVTFVSDGRTIVTYICNYGDTVTPPEDPKKAANDKFSYTFAGWSPTVSEVTESVTYTAMYTAVPLPERETSMKISDYGMKLLLLACVGGGCLVFIALPSAIMTAVIKRKRRRLTIGEHKPKSDK